MISYLKGMVAAKKPDHIVIDVQGVGYEVFVSFKTFQKIPADGDIVKLHIHSYYREDMQKLFGFAEEKEKTLFRMMIAISGIGPKVALAALSSMTVEDFEQIVVHQDVVALTRVPGIGRKGAERLIIEMKDKVKAIALEAVPELGLESSSLVTQDVLMALMSLGYKEPHARKALSQIEKDTPLDDMDFQEIMRRCLASV